jgi:hypothetical protein
MVGGEGEWMSGVGLRRGPPLAPSGRTDVLYLALAFVQALATGSEGTPATRKQMEHGALRHLLAV